MKRHGTDTVSLVFGLIFAAIVAWWGIATITNRVDLPMAWIGVGMLIVIGTVGVVSSVTSRRTRTAPALSEPDAPLATDLDTHSTDEDDPTAESDTKVLADEEPATVEAGTEGNRP